MSFEPDVGTKKVLEESFTGIKNDLLESTERINDYQRTCLP